MQQKIMCENIHALYIVITIQHLFSALFKNKYALMRYFNWHKCHLSLPIAYLHLSLHFFHFFCVFIQDVSSYKLWFFELFAAEGTQPLVFGKLHCVGCDKSLHFREKSQVKEKIGIKVRLK